MKVNLSKLNSSSDVLSLDPKILDELKQNVIDAKRHLLEVNNAKSDMTGWIDYPNEIPSELINDILITAEEVKKKCEILVVIGVGGSYLGTKAIFEALNPQRRNFGELKLIFAGFSLSSSYTSSLLEYLKDKAFCINYVSKSGTTLEPAIAFRLFKNLLIKQHKDAYNNWIYVTTNENDGNALIEAKANGYKYFLFPENIGGRYSCMTACTLFPLACKDVDIKEFIDGAKEARIECINNEFEENAAMQYAYGRNVCYKAGKVAEALCVFSPRLNSLLEWWKQLYGESEGKDKKGLFPVGLSFSTDLHSLGQFVQDGSKILFETFIDVDFSMMGTSIKKDEYNYDGLNYLEGYDLHFINDIMLKAAVTAHSNGGTPIIGIRIKKINTYALGQLMYMFMFSCAISAYMIGVNPFNQPAVNKYKDKMYELLKNKCD